MTFDVETDHSVWNFFYKSAIIKMTLMWIFQVMPD